MERSTAEGENYIAGGVVLADHDGRVYATHVHSWEIFVRMVSRTRHVMYMFNQVHEMISIK